LFIVKTPSKLLGPKHGDDQVNEAAEGDEADDDIFHDRWAMAALADFIAKADIGGGGGKEPDREPDEPEIVHANRILPSPSRA
jgi:hypothetical protein